MLDSLYENIGGKIKSYAKWVFIIEAICAVITGIAMIATNDDMILYGILTLVLGPVIAWVGSWILYAFGQLVEDVHAMRNEEGTEAEEKAKREKALRLKREAEEKAKRKTASSFCNKCELCGKESDNLHRCKIDDTVGWADLCNECAQKH